MNGRSSILVVMTSFNLQTLLRQARRLKGPHSPGVPTDAQLLERLVAHGDEAAFEVVVWRHGPMVLSVCRRVLHQEQDAEDAFQATFLALVRKASSIHRHDAVASWLYRVAQRIALRARAMAAQRGAVEKQVAVDACAVAVDCGWCDLRPLLDLEVNRLPERYRLPLVLCYFEGRTADEAAQQLRCPRGTILSRLARAREKLRSRLSRRGLALSAGLLALSLKELAPATLSAALVESVVRTCVSLGAGAVAAPVAALTEGVLRAMFLNKLKLTAALALASGLLAAGTALVTHQALATPRGDTSVNARSANLPDETPKKAAAPAPPKQETQPITVSGTSVNSRGDPLKGVTVYLLSTNGLEAVIGSTKTDADGHYRFKDAPLPIRRFDQPGAHASGTFQVCGVAPGHGFAWHGMRFFYPRRARPADWNPNGEDYSYFKDEPIEMKLKLEPAARLQGRLVDEAGKPVAGAKIRLRNADYFDVAGKEKHINFREFWSIAAVPESLTSAVTDKDGRFQIDDLPPEVVFWTWVEHSQFAPLTLYAVTTDRKVTERDYEAGQKQPVYAGTIDLALARPRRVLIHAVYDDSGKAAPGIRISTGGAGASAVGYSAHGTTDAEGKLLLRLPPGDYPLVADPPGDVPCIRTRKNLAVAAAPDEQPCELRMDVGCVLILEVVDEATGKGIPQVHFGQEAEEGSEIFRGAQGATGRISSSYSDASGRLRLVVTPGKRKYTVAFGTLPQDYEIVQEVDDVPGKPGTREVELPAAKTVTVKFKLRKKQ
jgi:DNA-directed RNA polymerase specialized sigma24 family protein/protocatechuate 3,4-dioxygenase beta subunit